jgi:hypothetical protein
MTAIGILAAPTNTVGTPVLMMPNGIPIIPTGVITEETGNPTIYVP